MNLAQLPQEELLHWAGLEAEARQYDPIMIPFTVPEWWLVFGNLQLALSHPKNQGVSSAVVRGIAKRIEQQVTQGAPHMAEVARRGWMPQHGGKA